jgi:hypothetical protein
MAMAEPVPVVPAAVALSAPMSGMVESSDGGTGMSSVTDTTPGSAESLSRPALSTRSVVTGDLLKERMTSPASEAVSRSPRVAVTTLTRIFLPPSAAL